VSSDLLSIFLLSLAAMFNPSLIAAVTVMLLIPNPKRLMVGYLLGAYLVATTLGLVIVFSLQGSQTESTSKHVGPTEDLVVGVLLLVVAFVLGTGRDAHYQERRRAKKEAKLRAREEEGKPTESLPIRLLGKGDPRLTFVVGGLLSFPGASYLLALDHMHKLNVADAVTVLLVIGFVLIELLFLEVPLLGYALAPERTQRDVNRFKDWMARRGRTAAVIALTVLGVWLLIRGVLGLV
jgi:hypothetical protein